MLAVPNVVLGDHLTIYVNQTIMLYAFNLYTDACQLFLNNTGGKNLGLNLM